MGVGCGFGHTVVLTRAGWPSGGVRELWRVGGWGGARGRRRTRWRTRRTRRAWCRRLYKQLKAVAAISAGDNHSVRGDERAASCGAGAAASGVRLGTGASRRTSTRRFACRVSRGEVVRQVSCGAYHTAVLTQSRNVYAFGWNKQGRVGVGRQSSLLILAPTLLASLSPSVLSSPIAGLCAGQQHTVVWSEAGGVMTWGAGSGGCLGHGDEEDVWEPKGVQALQGVKVTQCAVGAAFSLAASDRNSLYSWGSNRNGELARSGNPLLPAAVTLPSTVGALRSLVCGKSHALLIADGGLYSWGMAARGVLGRGEGCDGGVVGEVKGVTGRVVSAAASWSHTAVVTAEGRTYSWGARSDGKLGFE